MPRSPLRQKPKPEEIARLYLAGHTLKQVAGRLKIATSQVYDILVRLGVPRRLPGPTRGLKLTGEQREQMRADLRAGEFPNMAVIARKYGVSREYVRIIAASAGITGYTLKGRVKAARERERKRLATLAAAATARERQRKRMAQLWQGGASCKKIARILGIRSACAANSLLSYYRKRFPADFPRRGSWNCSPEEMRERERARAAKVAQLAARLERSRLRRELLAELWQNGATADEIASVFGVTRVAIHGALGYNRRLYPAEFPIRPHRDRRQGRASQV